MSTEIVSKKEIELISPFTFRLHMLAQTQRTNKFFHHSSSSSSSSGAATPLCIEDIPVINYDRFFRHFTGKRALPRLTPF